MKKPVLVILAAGMGSRYGGLKQVEPVGPSGEVIIDYSLYDAKQAGFEEVIFIIKHEIEDEFKEVIGNRISKYLKVSYAFQELNQLPEGYEVPTDREKPWGTTHAMLSAKELIDGPFLIINADDFYGADSYKTAYNFLANEMTEEPNYAMVGYRVENTLTDMGAVTRGVCQKDANGNLTDIVERQKIEKSEKGARFTEDDGKTWTDIESGNLVSMNYWALNKSFIDKSEKAFAAFLDENLPVNPLKCEYLLPNSIGAMIKNNEINVKVLESGDNWYGITYKEDKPDVVNAIAKKHTDGIYPTPLWDNL